MTDKKKTVSELTDKELLKTAAKKVAEHARTASDAAKEEALHLREREAKKNQTRPVWTKAERVGGSEPVFTI